MGTVPSRMSDKKCSLVEGSYKAVGTWYSILVVEGDTLIVKKNNGGSHDVHFKKGDFGEADPEIIKATGQEFYNIEFSYEVGRKLTEQGVITDDGLKITMKGVLGIAELEWVTEEEAAAILADGDPIEAPPGPYKIQPENLGKFIWISGGPGLGKSTTAQLLNKTAGYVYYEADCFTSCRNPYIPADAENPSLAQVLQKPLKGEGIKEREEICNRVMKQLGKMLADGDGFDTEILKEVCTLMCDDIMRERRRIGGDWVIAGAHAMFSKELRDFIRYKLGPDFVFVVLDMEMESVKQRIKNRHNDDEEIVNKLMALNKMVEAPTDDEENVVKVKITDDMNKEEVVSKILEMVR